MRDIGNDELIKISIACVAGGLYMLFKAVRHHKRFKLTQDTPRSRVSSAAQGFVELQGFAWIKGSVARTLKGAHAVYYSLVIEEAQSRGSGKNRRTEWVQLYNEKHNKPFFLLDGSGLAEVDPQNAQTELVTIETRSWYRLSSTEKAACTAKVGSVGNRLPFASLFGGWLTRVKVRESYILNGSPVYVTGDFRSDTGERQVVINAELSSFAKNVFHLESRSSKNLNGILDTNGDGDVSEQEARVGYWHAANAAISHPDPKPRPIQRFGRVSTSEHHELFVADMHEKHVEKRLGQWLWLRLAGGSLLTAIGIMVALRMLFPASTLNNWTSLVFKRAPANMQSYPRN